LIAFIIFITLHKLQRPHCHPAPRVAVEVVDLTMRSRIKYKGGTFALSMSAARQRELANEADSVESHPTHYIHKTTVHEPYMEYLLAHILTRKDEMTPPNQSLYEESEGIMRRRDHHSDLARHRAQLVNHKLALGLKNMDRHTGAFHTTKKTWHYHGAADTFRARYMPDAIHFNEEAQKLLVELEFEGRVVLTSLQIDRLQHFLASCLAERDATPTPNIRYWGW